MTLRTIFGRQWLHALGLVSVAAVGYIFGSTADRVTAQQPGTPPPAAVLPAPDKRVVAYIYNNVPVTREELGDFLIARGGHEKLELLVNKKIIEVEAARRNLTVTNDEVMASFNDDLKNGGIEKGDFIKHVLPKYGKSLYEWTEDVIKPRILLGKMCRDRVKVTDEDVKRAFENAHGERRQAQVICWSNDDGKIALKQWTEARVSEEEYDRVARTQADAALASSAGKINPIGKFPDVKDDVCTKVLYSLKVGEMSQLFQTPAGIMCVKCIAILPPNPNVKLEGKIQEALHKEMFDKKLTAEVPKFFTECKEIAKPNLLLKGPPSPREIMEGVQQGIQQAGIVVPMTPTPAPAPKP